MENREEIETRTVRFRLLPEDTETSEEIIKSLAGHLAVEMIALEGDKAINTHLLAGWRIVHIIPGIPGAGRIILARFMGT